MEPQIGASSVHKSDGYRVRQLLGLNVLPTEPLDGNLTINKTHLGRPLCEIDPIQGFAQEADIGPRGLNSRFVHVAEFGENAVKVWFPPNQPTTIGTTYSFSHLGNSRSAPNAM